MFGKTENVSDLSMVGAITLDATYSTHSLAHMKISLFIYYPVKNAIRYILNFYDLRRCH